MSHRPALLIVNGRSRRGAGAAETVTRVLREFWRADHCPGLRTSQ